MYRTHNVAGRATTGVKEFLSHQADGSKREVCVNFTHTHKRLVVVRV